MDFQGRYFKFIRWLVRLFIRAKKVPQASAMPVPAVYVGNHQNMRGPIHTLLWTPLPMRTWSLHVFVSYKSAYRHFMDYTLTVRHGLPKPLAALIASPFAALVSALLRSAGVIPVYRGSAQIRQTLQLTIDALARGESILIFPDINYADSNGDFGEIYTGFLQLERFYHKRTGKHLRLVPIHADSKAKELRVGNAVSYSDGETINGGKARVAKELSDAINSMKTQA